MNRAQIEQLIPHKGAMCLLAQVQSADADNIVCLADSHRDAANPLREAHGLPAAAVLEYAAQAMALHSIAFGGRPQAAHGGMLVACRELRLHVSLLNDLDATLEISATLLAATDGGFSYRFDVTAGGRPVAGGSATIAV